MPHPSKPGDAGPFADRSVVDLVPGAFVRHPDEPEWGVGQIQSVIGNRITVNFEDRGKVTIDASIVALVAACAEDDA